MCCLQKWMPDDPGSVMEELKYQSFINYLNSVLMLLENKYNIGNVIVTKSYNDETSFVIVAIDPVINIGSVINQGSNINTSKPNEMPVICFLNVENCIIDCRLVAKKFAKLYYTSMACEGGYK